jgi:hypothetical protein
MKRTALGLICGWLCVAASAQPPQPVRPAAPGPKKGAEDAGPKGEDKYRWVCKQLKLSPDQQNQAEALLDVYRAEIQEGEANKEQILLQIQAKLAALKAAQNQGNEAEVKRLQAELKYATPTKAAEKNFYDQLTAILTDAQKMELPALRERSEILGDMSLRPIHVLRAALKLNLTPEQRSALENVLDTFRTDMTNNRPQNKDASNERVVQLIQNIRGLLKPEQASQFDREVELLRADPPAANNIQLPAPTPTPPAAEGVPPGGK